MFQLFLNTVPAQMQQLENLVNDEKIGDIGYLAHQMKPSFSMVGIPELTTSFQSLKNSPRINLNFLRLKIELKP